MGKYQHHIFICMNERPETDPRGCCSTKGSEAIRAAFKEEIDKRGMKGTVRANQAGCLDTCGMGPSVVIYPEGIWYTVKTVSDVQAIVEEHLIAGKPVERLLMPASLSKG
jgi:(2Fe-2S) ferredoxin